MRSVKETSRRFWNKAARKYAARAVGDEAAYAHTLERVRAHIDGVERVLEVGCGTGTTAFKLAGCVGAYTASDLSEEMIDIALEKAAAADDTKIRFLRAALSDLPAEELPYDAVLAFSVLHLMEDPRAAVSRIADRLRPGGLFLSKTVCLGDMNPVFRFIIPVMRLFGKAPLVHFLTAKDVEAIISEGGFEIVETGTFPKSPPARFVVGRKT
ncbi:class I SAM-dependent methyltransferase [Stappia stellulata]|uniref:class I SAM-dependent methyltransferase n=1 Tax=Stappia stellulata TaxID=71235 RepID=UPI000417B129|nr:class I SAM-dependent methyltransferase [Stappia stellulata]